MRILCIYPDQQVFLAVTSAGGGFCRFLMQKRRDKFTVHNSGICVVYIIDPIRKLGPTVLFMVDAVILMLTLLYK